MAASPDLKKELHSFCSLYIENRAERIRQQLGEIRNALTSETKSSAGDKHETARAMLQLEMEKFGNQLVQAEKSIEILGRISPEQQHKKVGPGSLVHTSKDSYYLAISAGAAEIKERIVFCISAASPIGRLLIGKSEGDVITFKSTTFTVEQVL